MKALRIALLAALALAVAAPASQAATVKRCSGIGDTITKLRAKGPPCDSARTLAAKWAETAVGGSGGRVLRIDGFRCVRRDPPGPGRAVRCSKRDGKVFVAFRFRAP